MWTPSADRAMSADGGMPKSCSSSEECLLADTRIRQYVI